MRTTVDIDDKTLRAAKRLAAADGTTLSEVVRRALRGLLQTTRRRDAEPFELIVAGRRGDPMPSPAQLAALLDDEDLARLK